MKTLVTSVLLAISSLNCRTQGAGHQTNHPASAFPEWQSSPIERIEVTCKPAYYVRESDGFLVPAEEARRVKDFLIRGIVLSIVQPERLAGQVVAFHVDFPEKWDHWYKPDLSYSGSIKPEYIGRLAFMCDPGWHPAQTNRISRTPNKSGAANGSQPIRSQTNGTSSTAGSRR